MSVNSERIFRKVALERASSPEQLDLLMRVTNPRSWIMLLGLIVLLSTGIAWSIMGQIPVQVSSPAVLLNTGGIKNIVSLQGGQVTALFVAPGDVVEAGQVVAQVRPPGAMEVVDVTAVHTGRVLEVKTGIGELVGPDVPLASMEFTGSGVTQEALMYVSPLDSKRLSPGMTVKVVPVTARQEEYGYMLGEVLSVSDFPSSRVGLLNTLGSQEFVDLLVGTPAPVEVRVRLLEEPGNPSGYQWSSSAGPAFQLSSGTLASASIVVDTVRPIELVIPWK